MKRTASVFLPFAFLVLTALPAAADDNPVIVPMDGKVVTENHHGIGMINSVDVNAGKINLSCGPIASLHWKGRTMDFDIQDKALLANLKQGQNVSFTLIEVRKGKYQISEISVLK